MQYVYSKPFSFLRLSLIAETCGKMYCLDAKVILLFALLGTALAFRTPSELEDEENSLLSAETEGDESELALQEDKAEMLLTYAKLAEEHENVHCMFAYLRVCSS